MSFGSVVDEILEKSVVGSFSKIGFVVRKRLAHWAALDFDSLKNEIAIVTGASSGIGLFLAEQLVANGADVRLLVRNRTKTEAAITAWGTKYPSGTWTIHEVDTSDFASITRFVAEISSVKSIRLLVHNAGAITPTFAVNKDGIEVTTATQLVGPYLMTSLLKERLEVGRGRVLWMASGGMYSEPLDLEWLANPSANYRGVTAYAKIKRAQVSLVAEISPIWSKRGISMSVLHPGWVDTPGLRQSLPVFGFIMRPWLRTLAQGVDTALWLATVSEDEVTPGQFWFDRRSRSIYKTKSSRLSDTPENRKQVAEWCIDSCSQYS